MWTIQFDDREREILLEVLEAAEKQKLHELHHADRGDYKRLLRDRIESIERLMDRLLATSSR